MVSLKLEATDFFLTDAFLAHMFTCFYEYFYIKKTTTAQITKT